MITTPSNWECTDPGHLNADGASIEFEHTTKDLHAIVESGDEFFEDSIGYYTVIFDESGDSKETVEDHVFFDDEDEAKAYLEERLEKYN